MLFKIMIRFILILFLLATISSQSFSQDNSPYIKVILPNGGESWAAKSTQSIKWESSGVDEVKIEFSFNYGYSWHTITSSVEASTGQYSWTIPNSQTSGVLVKISDVSDTSIYDISDNSFRLFIGTVNKKSQSLNKATNVPDKTAVVTPSNSVRIWPLGDSITDGEGDDPTWNTSDDGYIAVVGYREKLFTLLSGTGYNFKFVGTRESGYDDVPTTSVHYGTDFYNVGRFNDGHGGWDAGGTGGNGSIADNVTTWLTTLQSSGDNPDVVICMAGTNDMDQNKPTNDIAGYIGEILDNIDSFNPTIRTIFATVIYNVKRLDAYNNALSGSGGAIQSLYNTKVASGQNVSLSDMYSILSKSRYPDYYSQQAISTDYRNVHPNGDGYTLMANEWFTALQNYLPLLQLKVFIQGPYAGSGLMSTNINSNLPSTSPYQDSNNNSAYLNGSNYVVVPYSIPSTITDWIQIEIRSSNGITVVESKSCFLRNDGQVIDPDGLSEDISLGIPPGNYYVIVKHRNHLAVMSADLMELNGITSYDFTTSSDKYYGASGGAIQLGTGVWGMISGDANGDGQVNATDRNATWNSRNQTGYLIEDVSLDGQVNATDRNTTWNNRNSTTQLP